MNMTFMITAMIPNPHAHRYYVPLYIDDTINVMVDNQKELLTAVKLNIMQSENTLQQQKPQSVCSPNIFLIGHLQ